MRILSTLFMAAGVIAATIASIHHFGLWGGIIAGAIGLLVLVGTRRIR
jgi:hypothetical protein